MNSEDHTVGVSWFKKTSSPDKATEIECDDMVSAYDLALQPGHHPLYGHIVVRLPSSQCADGASTIAKAHAQGGKIRAATDAATDLSWVGRVVDLPNGRVQVKWGDGTTSTVLPHEISVVKEQHYQDLEDEMGGEGDWVEDDINDERQDEDSVNNTIMISKIRLTIAMSKVTTIW